jgi:hypothetical protein
VRFDVRAEAGSGQRLGHRGQVVVEGVGVDE